MGNKTPGPTCQERNPVDIKDGTMCRATTPAPKPTAAPLPVRMFMQLAVAATTDGGVSGTTTATAARRVSPGPSGKLSMGVEMYGPGESPTFDSLQQEVAGLGIQFKKTRTIRAGTLAQYSADGNILLISEDAYQQYLKGSGKEELRRNITHELVHARQHKKLLQNIEDPKSRLRLLAKEALKMSQEEFVNAKWKQELEAEKTAWEAHTESIANFAKSRGQPFPPGFLKEIVDLRVQEFADQTKAAYEKDFRALYQRLQQEFVPNKP